MIDYHGMRFTMEHVLSCSFSFSVFGSRVAPVGFYWPLFLFVIVLRGFIYLLMMAGMYRWQESHPESHFRVPAIVTALEKMELTPKVSHSSYI